MDSSWQDIGEDLYRICNYVEQTFGFEVMEILETCGLQTARDDGQLAFSFLSEAASLFFLHNDPYQRLGAIVSTGRFCMSHGDTATARAYFKEALIDTTMLGVAPKFEAMLYEGLLVSGSAESMEQVSQWAQHELQLLEDIKQNEKADFLLQLELAEVRHNSLMLGTFSCILALLAIALTVTLFLLRRRSKALRIETERLQEAQRQDIERIANVETCLSVLRHDITPFISWLQNPSLPDELRREVMGQLIRTFENIKNWTNLSIPSGLQFRMAVVPLQDLFAAVGGSVNNMHRSKLTFHDTPYSVKGDPLLLEIMLRNLVNNALQHTEQGSVDIAAHQDPDDDGFVIVQVSDTGVGMSEEQLENLFRADKKIKNDTQPGYGTGFGLILCRYIIKKHDDNTTRGCRIWAESTLGKGSTFFVRLSNV